MKFIRPTTLAALALFAGLSIPASAQVRGAGQERDGSGGAETQRTGGVRPAGGAGGDAKQDDAKQDDAKRGRQEQRGDAQGGRGRQETPPIPTPDAQRGGAEQRGTEQRGGDATPPNDRQGERPQPEQRPAPQERPGQGAERGQGEVRSNAAKTLSPAEKVEFMRMLNEERNTYRATQAKINRLKTLAEAANDAERLRELEQLRLKENDRHRAVLERLRAQVGVDNFRVGMKRLEQAAGGDDQQRGEGAQRGGDPKRGGDPERGSADQRGTEQRGGNTGGNTGGEQRGAGAGDDNQGQGGGNGRGDAKRGGGR